MKIYDEIWAADHRDVEAFFHDHPGDVSVIPLPDRKIGAMTLPQTRIIIRGENSDVLYRSFFQRFMKAGG